MFLSGNIASLRSLHFSLVCKPYEAVFIRLNPRTSAKHPLNHAFKEAVLTRETMAATPLHTVRVCCKENETQADNIPGNSWFDYMFGV